MRRPFDGLGAATFVLSCVTAFYDAYREENEEFYAYPDYFTFQQAGPLVDYGWFDIWPPYKNVETERAAEAVLRAVNERAVDVLLVPDGTQGDPSVDDVALESARRRIDACYLYAPDGTLDESDFSIRLPRNPAWEWVRKTLDTVADEAPDLQERRRREWRERVADGAIIQEFRRLELDEAIRYLPDAE